MADGRASLEVQELAKKAEALNIQDRILLMSALATALLMEQVSRYPKLLVVGGCGDKEVSVFAFMGKGANKLAEGIAGQIGMGEGISWETNEVSDG